MQENQKLPEIKTLSREYMNKRIAFFSDQKGSKNPKTIKSYNLNTTRNKLGLRPRNLLVNLTNAIITPKNLKPNFP